MVLTTAYRVAHATADCGGTIIRTAVPATSVKAIVASRMSFFMECPPVGLADDEGSSDDQRGQFSTAGVTRSDPSRRMPLGNFGHC
jgi:hypothetical protein